MLKARLSRGDGGTNYIEVFCSDIKNGESRLFDTVIEYCAKRFSPNELRKVLRDCEIQIKKLGPENTPEIFNEMVSDLKTAMMTRGIYPEPPTPSVTITIVLPFYRRLKRLAESLKEALAQLFLRFKQAL